MYEDSQVAQPAWNAPWQHDGFSFFLLKMQALVAESVATFSNCGSSMHEGWSSGFPVRADSAQQTDGPPVHDAAPCVGSCVDIPARSEEYTNSVKVYSTTDADFASELQNTSQHFDSMQFLGEPSAETSYVNEAEFHASQIKKTGFSLGQLQEAGFNGALCASASSFGPSFPSEPQVPHTAMSTTASVHAASSMCKTVTFVSNKLNALSVGEAHAYVEATPFLGVTEPPAALSHRPYSHRKKSKNTESDIKPFNADHTYDEQAIKDAILQSTMDQASLQGRTAIDLLWFAS